MSNEITLNAEFKTVQASKAGKVTERGVLRTILNGDKGSREQLGAALYNAAIASANFGAIIADMQRVFPADKLALTKKERDAGLQSPFKFFDGAPFLDGVDGSLTPYRPEDRSMASCAMYAQAVVAKFGSKELRGERALWFDIAQKMGIRARQHAEEKQAALEAAKAE